jgi:hypothetical protein
MAKANMSEQQKQKFRLLTDKYGLDKDDFFQAPQGFVIITRTGIEKIQRGLEMVVQYEVVDTLCNVESGHYVIKAVAVRSTTFMNESTGKPGEVQHYVESYGEASPKNCRNAYPVAMAEKRALSRVVLKSADLYEMGIYGEDEIENS